MIRADVAVDCSPPTRGSPAAAAGYSHVPNLFPAHAGITRCRCSARSYSVPVPRPRGDHPTWGEMTRGGKGCSPPTRGSPGSCAPSFQYRRLFPAHAGITRWRGVNLERSAPVPRPRGDHPIRLVHDVPLIGCSPPTRGSPGKLGPAGKQRSLFPAHAGITRRWRHCLRRRCAVPRPAWLLRIKHAHSGVVMHVSYLGTPTLGRRPQSVGYFLCNLSSHSVPRPRMSAVHLSSTPVISLEPIQARRRRGGTNPYLRC